MSLEDLPVLALLSFFLGSLSERGHQAPWTLSLSQGACCALLLVTKTHPTVFPDLLVLLINLWGCYIEKSQKGGWLDEVSPAERSERRWL